MAGIIQKIRSILVPELGLEVEPEFVQEGEISTEFTRAIAHMAARTGNRSILVKATSDGRLLVASAGTASEIYVVEEGNAPDAYNALSTFASADAIYSTDLLIEDFPGEISFRDAAGVWGDEKHLPVGYYCIDFIHYGVRIQNYIALSVCAYQITTYR